MRSYGRGRYDRSYEEWGVDYPPAYVRWTEGRNLEAVLDLLAAGRLAVADLVTHHFALGEPATAYKAVERRNEPFVAIAFDYPKELQPEQPIAFHLKWARTPAGEPGGGFVGAGVFASSVLVPALRATGFQRLVSIASSSGLDSRRVAERAGFGRVVSDATAVVEDPDDDVVVIATAHENHAELIVAGLKAGKHVFCEKPLALAKPELEEVKTAWRAAGRVLLVGFDRRSSESVSRTRERFDRRPGPVVMSYRVNTRPVPRKHWCRDRRQGGRLLGEVCQFIDTCSALADGHTSAAEALATSAGELGVADDVVVALRLADASLAISYARSGHPGTSKERLEILGRGALAVIDDFRALTLDKRPVRLTHPGKDHAEEVAAFRALLTEGDPAVSESAFSSIRADLAAAASLSVSSEFGTKGLGA